MTKTELDQLVNRLPDIVVRYEAATDGPWEWEGRTVDEEDGWVHIPQGSHLGDMAIVLGYVYEDASKDCDFIAHARTDVPQLVEAVKLLLLMLQEADA